MDLKSTEDVGQPELFNRALKRKFTELEEITHRLKQRLSKVTNDDSDISDEFVDEFEHDLNTECEETESISFEKMLNNLPENLRPTTSSKKSDVDSKNETEMICSSKKQSFDDILNSITQNIVSDNSKILKTQSCNTNRSETSTITEPPIINTTQNYTSFDKIFENVTQKVSENQSSSSSSSELETNLKQKKSRIDSLLEKISTLTEPPAEQKIDSMLEKLSIINDESDKSFSNRYVSGCSVNTDPVETSNPLLKQLNLSPNLDPDLIFNPLLFQKIFSPTDDSTPRSEEFRNIHSLKSLVSSNSSTSVESFSESNTPRQAPEGGTNDK